jgi:hypothetical protein
LEFWSGVGCLHTILSMLGRFLVHASSRCGGFNTNFSYISSLRTKVNLACQEVSDALYKRLRWHPQLSTNEILTSFWRKKITCIVHGHLIEMHMYAARHSFGCYFLKMVTPTCATSTCHAKCNCCGCELLIYDKLGVPYVATLLNRGYNCVQLKAMQ